MKTIDKKVEAMETQAINLQRLYSEVEQQLQKPGAYLDFSTSDSQYTHPRQWLWSLSLLSLACLTGLGAGFILWGLK